MTCVRAVSDDVNVLSTLRACFNHLGYARCVVADIMTAVAPALMSGRIANTYVHCLLNAVITQVFTLSYLDIRA